MIDPYVELETWISEVVVLKGTKFMLYLDSSEEEIILFKITNELRVVLFKIEMLYKDTNKESFRIKITKNDTHFIYSDTHNAKLCIVNLIIENGIPFIINPMGRKRCKTYP